MYLYPLWLKAKGSKFLEYVNLSKKWSIHVLFKTFIRPVILEFFFLKFFLNRDIVESIKSQPFKVLQVDDALFLGILLTTDIVGKTLFYSVVN